jgi:hypothetical protein
MSGFPNTKESKCDRRSNIKARATQTQTQYLSEEICQELADDDTQPVKRTSFSFGENGKPQLQARK